MKRIAFLILIALLAAVFVYAHSNKEEPRPGIPTAFMKREDKVDHKASFAIFTHGTFRVFTASMYHDRSPDVFIQADNPNIVHVKKSNVTWDDFFRTLPFKLTKECLITGGGETFCSGQGGILKFYLNGKRNDDLLKEVVRPNDRVLVSFGNEKESQIKNQLDGVVAVQ